MLSSFAIGLSLNDCITSVIGLLSKCKILSPTLILSKCLVDDKFAHLLSINFSCRKAGQDVGEEHFFYII